MEQRYQDYFQSNITTYGIDNYANVLAKDITITNSYVDFRVKIKDRNERVKTGIPGRFSVYNSLAAICVAQKFEFHLKL
ncbi:MAG: Mur ligase family protein [Clostridia bacterium]